MKDNVIAEDVVQEVFVNLWNKRDTIEIKESLRAYLYRACYHRSLNHIKERASYLSISDVNYEEEGSTEILDNIYLRETSDKLSRVIEGLPVACRTVFLLSRMDELSYKEIATTLNISVSTVENHMVKALKVLRTAFNNDIIRGIIITFSVVYKEAINFLSIG